MKLPRGTKIVVHQNELHTQITTLVAWGGTQKLGEARVRPSGDFRMGDRDIPQKEAVDALVKLCRNWSPK
jgi:hypothetical protein